MLNDDKKPLTIAYKLTDKSLATKLTPFEHFPELKMIPAESIVNESEDFPLLRITKKGLFLEQNGQRLFFHPNMAILRFVNIMRGDGDRFLKAVELDKGDSFLDATMGLGVDILIASWAVGAEGKVLALESSPLIFSLVTEGLESMKNKVFPESTQSVKKQAWNELSKASSYIKTIHVDHLDYLKSLPDSSIDVIYFDPMFRLTCTKSSAMKPIKTWSNPNPIKQETIEQALRVAKRRIVLKERKNSPEFSKLGFKTILENKYSPIDFGIIKISEQGGV